MLEEQIADLMTFDTSARLQNNTTQSEFRVDGTYTLKKLISRTAGSRAKQRGPAIESAVQADADDHQIERTDD